MAVQSLFHAEWRWWVVAVASGTLLATACDDEAPSSSPGLGEPVTASTGSEEAQVTNAGSLGSTQASSGSMEGADGQTAAGLTNVTIALAGTGGSVTATASNAGGGGMTMASAGGADTLNQTNAASLTTGAVGPLPGAPVSVSGRQIQVGGQPIHLRGVNWNPVPIGGTHPADLAYADFAAVDIPLMQAAGINAVRTYEPLTDLVVLDALANAGIFVLNTVYPYGGNDPSSVDAHVNAVKDHPATLLYVIGNEWNYNGLYVELSEAESIARLNEVAARIRTLDAAHPIATVYGELPSEAVLSQLPDIEVWGLNVYSGLSFGERFSQWSSLSDKPMFFGEYGADAYNATLGQYDPESQATAIRELTSEILANSILDGGVCAGGMVFEFADEWWKDSNGSVSEQDVGGIAPGGGPYPDATFNEEYWGIVTIEREPRRAYEVLTELYVP